MGSILINALIKAIANNPQLLEQIVEAGVKLLAAELEKKASAA